MSKPVKKIKFASPIATGDHAGLVGGVSELLDHLATDLNSRFGRGFSRRNLQSMRQFYSFIPAEQIWQTLSAKSEPAAICSTLSGKSTGVIGSTLVRGTPPWLKTGMLVEEKGETTPCGDTRPTS